MKLKTIHFVRMRWMVYCGLFIVCARQLYCCCFFMYLELLIDVLSFVIFSSYFFLFFLSFCQNKKQYVLRLFGGSEIFRFSAEFYTNMSLNVCVCVIYMYEFYLLLYCGYEKLYNMHHQWALDLNSYIPIL